MTQKRVLAPRRRSASLSNSGPTVIKQGMEERTPTNTNINVPTNNRFGVLAHCLINDDETDTPKQMTEHKTDTEKDSDSPNKKPPPIYIHGTISHRKLLETLNEKYNNKFHAKLSADKLKIIFQHVEDHKDFIEICRNDKIQFHTYSIPSEKVLTVVLKGLIRLPDKTIINSLKTQGLNPLSCTEIPTHTKYPLFRITFAPGTTIAKINHVRFIENLKIYWDKYESKRPVIQCYRCQAHGHSSVNCNKVPKCVKCAGQHDTRTCTKTTETPPTCTNCGGAHPANYSNCPALLAFLAKRNEYKLKQARLGNQVLTLPPQQPTHTLTPNYPPLPLPRMQQQHQLPTHTPNPTVTYAAVTSRRTPPPPPENPLPSRRRPKH